jgi:large subunit ribosomal protein L21e
MPHSFGLRARTRHLFARKFRQHGPIRLSTYLRPYHVGDIVDIKANAAEQKGMPHKVSIVGGPYASEGKFRL